MTSGSRLDKHNALLDAIIAGQRTFHDRDLRHADLASGCFKGLALIAADFHGSDLHSTWFSGCNLQRSKFVHANIEDAHLNDVDLTDADLWRATLRHADLTGANLTRANLRQAVLQDVRLEGADADDFIPGDCDCIYGDGQLEEILGPNWREIIARDPCAPCRPREE